MQNLIDPDGRPRFGVFEDAVGDVNVADYRHRTPIGKRAGRLATWAGFKQFQYFGVISDELMFGCALAHLRHTAIAFAYVYEPGAGMLVEHGSRAPLGFGVKLCTSPVRGRSRYRLGRLDTTFGYEDAPRRKSIELSLGSQLKVDARFDESAAGFEPMSICTRIGRNGWVYAHKVAGVPVRGTVHCRGRRFDLEALGAYAHHDFSAGYMRRETFWNWACFSGRAADGTQVGLNVSCGVNETSFSENCVWIDGALTRVGLCHFEYDWDHPLEPWRISSEDGAVQIDFRAEGQHEERLQLGLVASDFKQVFGVFSGEIRLADGRSVVVDGMRGFVEDQYAKW
jgi:hypothetical protein